MKTHILHHIAVHSHCKDFTCSVFKDGVTIQKVQLFLHFGYGVLINVVQHHMPQMIGHVINSLARYV